MKKIQIYYKKIVEKLIGEKFGNLTITEYLGSDGNDSMVMASCDCDGRYGGRGVTVSIRWRGNFKAFYDWAIDKWKPGLKLDKDIRSDKKVGDFYCPELCCFVTHKENMRRTNMNVFIEYKGESLCVAEWCERFKIGRSCFNRRMEMGWPIEKIFTTPVKKNKIQ
jgi:hypothetical protein